DRCWRIAGLSRERRGDEPKQERTSQRQRSHGVLRSQFPHNTTGRMPRWSVESPLFVGESPTSSAEERAERCAQVPRPREEREHALPEGEMQEADREEPPTEPREPDTAMLLDPNLVRHWGFSSAWTSGTTSTEQPA